MVKATTIPIKLPDDIDAVAQAVAFREEGKLSHRLDGEVYVSGELRATVSMPLTGNPSERNRAMQTVVRWCRRMAEARTQGVLK